VYDRLSHTHRFRQPVGSVEYLAPPFPRQREEAYERGAIFPINSPLLTFRQRVQTRRRSRCKYARSDSEKQRRVLVRREDVSGRRRRRRRRRRRVHAYSESVRASEREQIQCLISENVCVGARAKARARGIARVTLRRRLSLSLFLSRFLSRSLYLSIYSSLFLLPYIRFSLSLSISRSLQVSFVRYTFRPRVYWLVHSDC